MARTSVVVVGAGIGGLTSALALLRAGLDVTVLERSSAPAEVGAGLTLFPNAMRALDAAGVGDAVRDLGAVPDQGPGGMRLPSGKWVARVHDTSVVGDMLVIHRAELHRALRELLPVGVLQPGVEVTGIRVTGDSSTRAVLATTTGEEWTADVVVAADGLRSPTRAQLFPDQAGVSYAGYTAWRAVTSTSVDVSDGAGETWGRGERFGIVPLPAGRVYWFAAANIPAGTAFDDELGEVRRRFGSWHPPIPALLDATRPQDVLHHDTYFLATPLPSFVHGRVALLGDAAHAMTPDLGQGACQAMEDAVTLAAVLRDGVDTMAALRRYDELRRRRTQAIVRAARRVSRFAQADGAVTTRLRELAVRVTPAKAGLRMVERISSWTPPEAGGE